MGFFEPPPPPPSPPEPSPQPVWAGPGDNVVGGAVALELVLARTDNVAILLRNFVAYPTGITFVLDTRRRSFDPDTVGDPLGHHMMRPGRGDPDTVLRFGVQFSDGAKATLIGHRHWPGPDEPLEQPVLMPRGGGGHSGRWTQDMWLWPLPPAGPFAFVVEWPLESIPETRLEIDAGLLLKAASRSEVLWDDVPPAGPESSSEFFFGTGYGG